MKLTNQQYHIIHDYLDQEGIQDQSLKSDFVDHLSCKIEDLTDEKGYPFEIAFEQAKLKCMPNGPQEFETDLKLLTTKKSNIMIRKIAFIGGYGSVLCICLAIMFFTLSSFKGKKTSLMLSSAQMEWRLNSPESSSFRASQEYKDFNRAEITANITSYKRYVLGETLLIVACLLFITTFLPYQFYSKYQKQNLGIAQV